PDYGRRQDLSLRGRISRIYAARIAGRGVPRHRSKAGARLFRAGGSDLPVAVYGEASVLRDVFRGRRDAAGASDQGVAFRLWRRLRGAEDATASRHAGARFHAVAVGQAVSARVFDDGTSPAERMDRASGCAGEETQEMRPAQRPLLLL